MPPAGREPGPANKGFADTIVAVATPHGRGGVGIVRVSGPGAFSMATSLFRSSREDFQGFKPYRLHHGLFLDSEGRPLDEVLVSSMPGPGSFTGEDVVEVNCHGGPAILRAVLESFMDRGARLARPGEFTLRAFLNGRLDLTQAEAVAELIAAPTRAGLDLSLPALQGSMSFRVSVLRENLENLKVQMAVAVDFPEDEVECLSKQALAEAVKAVLDQLEDMLESHQRNRCWREGAVVVLAGRVNAGKSSLMNAFLGRERAIVSDLPGTTRDYLEEGLDLDGLAVRLVDTAGMREAQDAVEEAGVRRSREFVDRADLVLLVVDRTRSMDPEDQSLAESVGRSRVLVAANKQDLTAAVPDPMLTFERAGFATVPVSARTGQGLTDLLGAIRQMIAGHSGGPDPGEVVPNLRQSGLLAQARQELEDLLQDLAQGLPYDLLAVRLDMACAHLDEITGRIAPEDVLERIFGQFCIGK